MKKLFTFMAIAIAAISLTGCGQRVTIAPNEVGQIMTPSGYTGKIIPTSTFRLDMCFLPGQVCDKLVTLNTADQEVVENIELFMPKDKLKMTVDIRMVIAVNPAQYQLLFNKVPAVRTSSGGYSIPIDKAYRIYAKQVARTISREMLSQYTIAEIASNREVVGAELAAKLSEYVQEKTPFIVQYSGLASVKYPPVVTEAQEKAAQRREQIAEEQAITQKNLLKLERDLQEAKKQRAIDVEKAEAEASVNKIMADSLTPEYVQYKQIEIMLKLAESENKVFMPYGMIDSIGGQVLLGNQK